MRDTRVIRIKLSRQVYSPQIDLAPFPSSNRRPALVSIFGSSKIDHIENRETHRLVIGVALTTFDSQAKDSVATGRLVVAVRRGYRAIPITLLEDAQNVLDTFHDNLFGIDRRITLSVIAQLNDGRIVRSSHTRAIFTAASDEQVSNLLIVNFKELGAHDKVSVGRRRDASKQIRGSHLNHTETTNPFFSLHGESLTRARLPVTEIM